MTKRRRSWTTGDEDDDSDVRSAKQTLPGMVILIYDNEEWKHNY